MKRNFIKDKTYVHIAIIAISTILLLQSPSLITNVILFILSLFLYKDPIAYLPLVFVSAMDTSIVVLPGIAAVFYYLYLFLITSIFFRKEYRLVCPVILCILILYSVHMITSSYYSVTGNVYQAYRILMAIIPIIFLSFCSYNQLKLTDYMVTMALVASIYIFTKLIFSPNVYSIQDQKISISISEHLNPNTLAQFSVILGLILFVISIEIKKLLLLICTLFPLGTLIFLGSRTSFISFIVVAIFYMIFFSNINWKKKLLFVIACIGLGGLFSSIVLSMNDRLTISSIIEDGGSGRFYTWKLLFNDVIPNHLLMGIGYGKDNIHALGYMFDGDNLYVDLLTQLGIIGVLLLFSVLILLFLKMFRIKEQTGKLASCFIFAIFMLGMGETVFDTFLFWSIILFSFIVLSSYSKKSKRIYIN